MSKKNPPVFADEIDHWNMFVNRPLEYFRDEDGEKNKLIPQKWLRNIVMIPNYPPLFAVLH